MQLDESLTEYFSLLAALLTSETGLILVILVVGLVFWECMGKGRVAKDQAKKGDN